MHETDDENEEVESLKQAYSDGRIGIEEFESRLSDAVDVRDGELNTTDSLPMQIWMSEERSDEPSPEKFDPIDPDEMHLPIKPKGGMWTSTYTPDEEYDSDWIRWCSTEGFYGGRHMWLMKPKEELDVLVVDSMRDLEAVVSRYEKKTYNDVPASRLSDSPIDFLAISDEYDAVRLTKDGQARTRMPGMGKPNLYGWDSESVLHLRWNFVEWEYVEKCENEVKY